VRSRHRRRVAGGRLKRGEDEPGVCPEACVFGLDDNAAFAIPGCRSILELAEEPLLGTGLFIVDLGLLDKRGAKSLEPGVASDADDIVDPVRLAPAKHLPPAEAAVAPENDFHIRPGLSYPFGQQGQDGPRMLRTIDLRWTQVGAEQVRAAKDIERKEAVVVIVAVEETSFLIPVHHVVGRIEVEDDLLWRDCVRRDELVDEQGIRVH